MSNPARRWGGGVVLAQWTLSTEMLGGGIHDFNKLHEFETTTDQDGRFVIPAWGPELRTPNAYLTKHVPEFRIFTAGYFPRFLANDRCVDPESATVISDWNGKSIALKPFDGDWRRYAQLLRALWAAHPWQCRRSCPRLILAVYDEWRRIAPSLSPEIRRFFGPPPLVRNPSCSRSHVLGTVSGRSAKCEAGGDLHQGVEMTVLKQRFQELIRDIDPSEIAKMEQRLMAEGTPESEVKRLCDVHVEVFKEPLSAQDAPVVPPVHPIHTFMLENRAAEGILHELDHVLARLGDAPDKAAFGKEQEALGRLVGRLAHIDLHYLGKENQLLPVLEVHGITGPSQVMWALHDDIRLAAKSAKAGVRDALVPEVVNTLRYLSKSMRDMIYKEERMASGIIGR